jgi:hypothetical protein
MALVLADRVKESCSSPGTGTVTLLGAQTEYKSFSAGVGANNTTYYTIADQSGSNWEVGLGTVGSGGTTLARTTVLSSSNSGSLVNFASGTQDVWCDYPSEKAVYKDASGNVTAYNFSTPTIVDYETWASQATNPSYAAGVLWYAQDNDALTFYNGVTGNDLHLGQEVQVRVYNTTGSTIPVGSAVYINGQHSQFPTVALAQANSASTANAIGLTNTAITNNNYGYVVVLGKFTGIDTHSFTAGDTMYLSATTAGALTNTAPSNPNLVTVMGYCVYSNPSQGVVEVTVPLPPVSATSLTGVLPVVNGGTGLSSVGSSGQIITSTGTGLTYTNRTQYLGVLLNGGSTTQVPTSNGYIGILLNGGSTTQVPIN